MLIKNTTERYKNTKYPRRVSEIYGMNCAAIPFEFIP